MSGQCGYIKVYIYNLSSFVLQYECNDFKKRSLASGKLNNERNGIYANIMSIERRRLFCTYNQLYRGAQSCRTCIIIYDATTIMGSSSTFEPDAPMTMSLRSLFKDIAKGLLLKTVDIHKLTNWSETSRVVACGFKLKR